jgi:predicted site-specific integrase-resolvase
MDYKHDTFHIIYPHYNSRVQYINNTSDIDYRHDTFDIGYPLNTAEKQFTELRQLPKLSVSVVACDIHRPQTPT